MDSLSETAGHQVSFFPNGDSMSAANEGANKPPLQAGRQAQEAGVKARISLPMSGE